MRVVVTGATGCLGQVVTPLLCNDPRVQEVRALDMRSGHYKHPKFRFFPFDMRQSVPAEAFVGADTVIHLAFAIAQGTMTPAEMRENNVGGTINVYRAAGGAGVKKVINLSSVSVYGSGEGLTEATPVAPSSRFPYAHHKVEIERRSKSEFPHMDFVHLRATYIFGPRAALLLRKMCTGPFYISPPPPHPRVQIVHEDDVAAAIMAALDPAVRSDVFNLAAPEVVTFPAIVKHRRRFVIGLPISLIEVIAGRPPPDGSPRLRPRDTTLDMLRTTLTVSCDHAKQVLHWTPRFTPWQARECFDLPAPAPLGSV